MKVAVLGAGGTIAPAIVRDLAESDEVAAMLLLDIDEDRAARSPSAHGGGKAQATRATPAARPPTSFRDPRDRSAATSLINSATYRVNLDAMRACLQAGCHYLDLGGLYWVTKRQLELSAEFEQAGLLGDARHRLDARARPT